MKFRWLREGQYVRIRAATLEHHDKYERTFGLKNYSNILALPYPSHQARTLKFNQPEATKTLDKELLLLDDKIMHPLVATHITQDNYKHLPIRSLEQILDLEKKQGQEVYRTRFSVEAILPALGDLTSLVKI